MTLEEAYRMLGVMNNDDLKTIRKAYRSLMLKYHPDISKEPNCLEISRKIIRAYEIIIGKMKPGHAADLDKPDSDPPPEKVVEFQFGTDTFAITERELLMHMYRPGVMRIAKRIGLESFAEDYFVDIFAHIYHRYEKLGLAEDRSLPATVNDEVSFEEITVEIMTRLILRKPIQRITIHDLKSIQELDLAESQLTSTADLPHFRNLKTLDISFTSIDDWEPLNHLTQLEVLVAAQCEAADQPLHLPGLKELYISYCGLNDFDHLQDLTSLELLDISANELSDVNQLGEFLKLTDLILYNNKLNHVEGIERFQHLRRLDLSLNPIQSVEPLIHLPNLEMLNLNWTRIEDFTPLLEMNALRFVDVSYFSDAILERHNSIWSALREKGVYVKT